jgi:hypothetical protein
VLTNSASRAQGGAQVKEPTAGWDNQDLPVYFNQRAQFTARTPTRVIPTPTSSPKPTPKPEEKKKSNVGAIAGGVVGGVVLLAAIAFLVFWIMRKKRRANQGPKTSEPPPPPPGVAVMPSPLSPPYPTDPKYSVISSTPLSPDLTSKSPVQSFTHSSPYTTPPPPQPIYHPAHVPPPMPSSNYIGTPVDPNAPLPMSIEQHQQNTAYYPPPGFGRPEAQSVQSHEMPTVRSPDAHEQIIQPFPMKNP